MLAFITGWRSIPRPLLCTTRGDIFCRAKKLSSVVVYYVIYPVFYTGIIHAVAGKRVASPHSRPPKLDATEGKVEIRKISTCSRRTVLAEADQTSTHTCSWMCFQARYKNLKGVLWALSFCDIPGTRYEPGIPVVLLTLRIHMKYNAVK